MRHDTRLQVAKLQIRAVGSPVSRRNTTIVPFNAEDLPAHPQAWVQTPARLRYKHARAPSDAADLNGWIRRRPERFVLARELDLPESAIPLRVSRYSLDQEVVVFRNDCRANFKEPHRSEPFARSRGARERPRSRYRG